MDDLLKLMPARLSRFTAGTQPLPGVDWELQELLGVGGFGEVWKARNPHLSSAEPVALKFCLDPAAAKVLRNEAAVLDRVMRQGKHPGVVQLLRTYLSAATPCLEYEFVEGGDLGGLITEWHCERGGPTAIQGAWVIHRLAEIVGFAHRLDPPVVHRDLKPANILVYRKPDGKTGFKIADFGIGGVAVAQAIGTTRGGGARGALTTAAVHGSFTPLYASPQQMRGDPPSPADDVYSLGVVWYQMICGDVAVGRPGGSRWRKSLVERGISSELVELLESCFEEQSADRPDDAAVLANHLLPLLDAGKAPTPEQKIKAEAVECERVIAAGGNSSTYLKANYQHRFATWRQYAERGMAEAQWLYGDCFLEGIGIKEDSAAAVRWFRMAAEQGLALAQMSLGNRYYRGEGVPEDIPKAIPLVQEGSRAGAVHGQVNLGANSQKWWLKGAGRATAACWLAFAGRDGSARISSTPPPPAMAPAWKGESAPR